MTVADQRALFDEPPAAAAVAVLGNRFAKARPLAACEVCGSTDYAELRIHDGQSLSRYCRRCGRFMGFPIWYGHQLTPATTGVDST